MSKFDMPDFSVSGDCINKDEHHIVGYRMRLNFRSEIKLDERWKSALSGKQREVFERRCGALNQNLGYV